MDVGRRRDDGSDLVADIAIGPAEVGAGATEQDESGVPFLVIDDRRTDHAPGLDHVGLAADAVVLRHEI